MIEIISSARELNFSWAFEDCAAAYSALQTYFTASLPTSSFAASSKGNPLGVVIGKFRVIVQFLISLNVGGP